MTINKQGTLIATCSDKGTLIRFWDTKTGEKWHEVRRGKDSCTISHIAFDQSGDYLTCSRNPDTDGTSTINSIKKYYLNKHYRQIVQLKRSMISSLYLTQMI